MTDRPIIFSVPMVRALLDGRKSQTRRIIKPQPKLAPHHEPVRFETRNADKSYWLWMCCTDRPSYQFATGDRIAPYIVGDRLWVREAWRTRADGDPLPPREMYPEHYPIFCEADRDNCDQHGRVRAAMHMPRWASRCTLIVSAVKVERLQDISREDAIAEGCRGVLNVWPDSLYSAWKSDPLDEFCELWEEIHGTDSWEDNPWVCAVSFRCIRKNIDQIERDAA